MTIGGYANALSLHYNGRLPKNQVFVSDLSISAFPEVHLAERYILIPIRAQEFCASLVLTGLIFWHKVVFSQV